MAFVEVVCIVEVEMYISSVVKSIGGTWLLHCMEVVHISESLSLELSL